MKTTNIIKLTNPVKIVLYVYTIQFLGWILFFDYAEDVYNVWKTMYITLESVTKHFLFTVLFLFSIKLGMFYGKKNKNIKVNILNNKNFNFIFFIFFILFILVEILYMLPAFSNINYLLEEAQKRSLTVFAYEAINEKTSLNTLTNLFPLIITIYALKKNIRFKKTIITLMFLVLFIHGSIFSARILFVDLIIIYSVSFTYIHNVEIKKNKLFLFLFLSVIFVFLSELFRYGLLNSYVNNIDLYSFENFIDVLLYLTTAYLGSDVNNTMIFYDSLPSYRLVSSGSPFLYNLLEPLLNLNTENNLIVPIERHGTLNFLALIWNDWGYFGIPIIISIGMLTGYSYIKGMIYQRDGWLIYYIMTLPALIFSFRINYYFATFYLIPVFILILILSIFLSYQKRRIS